MSPVSSHLASRLASRTHVASLSLAVAAFASACTIYTGAARPGRQVAGAQQPAQPAPAQPAPAPAATTTPAPAATTPPAPAGAAQPAAIRPRVVGAVPTSTTPPAPVGSITVNGKPVTVLKGSNAFGEGTPWPDALQGLVYFVPSDPTRGVPDVSEMLPSGALFARELNVSRREFKEGFPPFDPRAEWFVIRYSGSFTTSQAAGDWQVRLVSENAALVKIDGKVVVDAQIPHSVREDKGTIALSPGTHAISVDYFKGAQGQVALQLFVKPPGANERLWASKL